MPLTEEEIKKIKEKVIAVLKESYDPEIPVNVWDLGLIYRVDVTKEGVIEIDMTLTTPGCPIAGMIVEIVKANVTEAFGGKYDVKVNLVWDPPWTPSRVTEEGRKQLQEIYGYDIVGEWIERMKENEG